MERLHASALTWRTRFAGVSSGRLHSGATWEEGEMLNIFLTREEAATALRISVRNVDCHISRGELNVRRIGRRVLIHVDEVKRFANAPEPPASSSANGPAAAPAIACALRD